MKYVIASIIALIVIFGIGFLIALLLLRNKNTKHRGLKTVGITILSGLLLAVIILFGYFSIYSHAKERAKTALLGTNNVKVSKIDGGFFFDGPSDSNALIFYPGAKVDCKAYAPLMLQLAQSGFDCFLADMPFNFALFGINIADKFVNSYNYDHWIIAGHSMGGTAAACYLQNTAVKFDGLILLASYITTEISNDITLLSIYGSLDGCLELDVYSDNKINWPKNSYEVVINGGNHAQFGDYGFQKGDNAAAISAIEQQRQTVEAISSQFLP